MLKSWRVCLRCLNYIVLWEFEKKYSKTTSPSIAIHFFARHLRCPLWGIAVSEGFCKYFLEWCVFLNLALWYHSDIVGSIQLVDPSSTWNVVPCGASSSGVKPGHEVVAWFSFFWKRWWMVLGYKETTWIHRLRNGPYDQPYSRKYVCMYTCIYIYNI